MGMCKSSASAQTWTLSGCCQTTLSLTPSVGFADLVTLFHRGWQDEKLTSLIPYAQKCDSLSKTTLGATENKTETKTQGIFNSAVINYYADGTRYIGPHKDKDAMEGPIASFSLYEDSNELRTFVIYESDKKTVVEEIPLEDGSCFIMMDDFQKGYYHAVPKPMTSRESKVQKGRINITFRQHPPSKTTAVQKSPKDSKMESTKDSKTEAKVESKNHSLKRPLESVSKFKTKAEILSKDAKVVTKKPVLLLKPVSKSSEPVVKKQKI